MRYFANHESKANSMTDLVYVWENFDRNPFMCLANLNSGFRHNVLPFLCNVLVRVLCLYPEPPKGLYKALFPGVRQGLSSF